MSDLVFNGGESPWFSSYKTNSKSATGKFGIWVGNQQFTVRNITINNAQTAIYSIWNWGKLLVSQLGTFVTLCIPIGWTFQRVHINNCQVRKLTSHKLIKNDSC